MIGTLKIIETYGEGVFEFSDSFINVVIPFNKKVLKNRDNINGDINNKLSENQNKIISELIINPNLTQNELSEKLNLGSRTMSRLMAELQNNKVIERVGSNKTGYWKVFK